MLCGPGTAHPSPDSHFEGLVPVGEGRRGAGPDVGAKLGHLVGACPVYGIYSALVYASDSAGSFKNKTKQNQTIHSAFWTPPSEFTIQ